MTARSLECSGYFPPRPLNRSADPRHVLRAWPADRALAVLWSSATEGKGAERWSRWTILAEPVGTVRTVEDAGGGLETAGEGRVPQVDVRGGTGDPLAWLGAAAAATRVRRALKAGSDEPPFVGGWIGALSYDLGRSIEPRARHAGRDRERDAWPRMLMHRCPAAYVHDRVTGRWWVVGAPAEADTLPDAEELFAGAVEGERGFTMGEPCGGMGGLGRGARERYERQVARVVEYIRAGDVFQANVAHELRGAFAGSMRACFAELVERAGPWYGAYVEDSAIGGERAALASISPELFLDFDPTSRVVTTRPIKGTRRGDERADALAESSKDSAELAMIVDLMRNDLGRVCEFGSVRVPEARLIERHAVGGRAGGAVVGAGGAGVLHGVATVEGRLRERLGIDDLLRATFPGGSITGAPKIRAMQIIDELEVAARGPYTGSIGYISDCGRACFNIAIRTAVLRGAAAGGGFRGWLDAVEAGTWSYSVGAGIVADSDPAAEWDETLAKAEPILGLCRDYQEQACPTPPTPAIA